MNFIIESLEEYTNLKEDLLNTLKTSNINIDTYKIYHKYNIIDRFNDSSLLWCIDNQYLKEALELLDDIEKCNINHKNIYGNSALMEICYLYNYELSKFHNNEEEKYLTILIEYSKIIDKILSYSDYIDFNIINNYGHNVLTLSLNSKIILTKLLKYYEKFNFNSHYIFRINEKRYGFHVINFENSLEINSYEDILYNSSDPELKTFKFEYSFLYILLKYKFYEIFEIIIKNNNIKDLDLDFMNKQYNYQYSSYKIIECENILNLLLRKNKKELIDIIMKNEYLPYLGLTNLNIFYDYDNIPYYSNKLVYCKKYIHTNLNYFIEYNFENYLNIIMKNPYFIDIQKSYDLLIELNEDFFNNDGNSLTPFNYACFFKNEKLVLKMLDYPNIFLKIYDNYIISNYEENIKDFILYHKLYKVYQKFITI